jgi:hypothetical protein
VRGWDGIWETSFGRLRLVDEGARVRGLYECGGPSSLEGATHEGALDFDYREPAVCGSGSFELAQDGASFAGRWRAQGETKWSEWNGWRLQAEAGITWLVVLEAHWQRSLNESEYAFGNMLREIFARTSRVRVRQRFFDDAESLEQWCRELAYLPEPVVLIIASHGVAEGLSVRGKVIDTDRIFESLRHAGSLKLLHFSSCLIGVGRESQPIEQPFPVSGYTTSVDWGASALLEFTYLDLILNRDLEPAKAAAILPTLISFAGDRTSPGSPYPAAGFRFFPASCSFVTSSRPG